MTMTMTTDAAEPPELSLTRDRVARVLAMLEAKRANGGLDADETKALEVATLRLYGAGTSPKKFARLDAQQVDGVLRGQYRFAGAGQTGRLSSRGAQIHNLTRDVLGDDGAEEAALVDTIADGCELQRAGRGAARSTCRRRASSPCSCAPPSLRSRGKRSCGRIGRRSRRGSRRGSPRRPAPIRFSTSSAPTIAIPSRPDIYTLAAADILHKDPRAITKTERAIGKVAMLALGFGGSVGALQSMALNYRINLDDAEARRIVDAWREANPWAREFWGAHRDGESFGLWGAAMSAWELPGQITTAGRLAFVYRDDYLGGALFMALPSGRLLTYPRPRWREVDVLDKDGKPTGEKRTRAVVPARARAREAMARHALRECGAGRCRRPPARDGHADRNEPGAGVHADPHDDA